MIYSRILSSMRLSRCVCKEKSARNALGPSHHRASHGLSRREACPRRRPMCFSLDNVDNLDMGGGVKIFRIPTPESECHSNPGVGKWKKILDVELANGKKITPLYPENFPFSNHESSLGTFVNYHIVPF